MTSLEQYVGQTLDEKYRLERLLGQGGMGAVYLATHLGTERYVALKLIAPQFMRNQEFVARFKREARAAGRLRHPNVVDVTDFGFGDVGTETVAYLVMEYLDGCTLGDVLTEERRLPLEWVVDILEQVCSAVHEAHQQGIVHRDLKPENIWLEPNRMGGYRVKVLDFGIAKLAEVETDGSLPDSAATSTQLKTPAMHTAPHAAGTSLRAARPTAAPAGEQGDQGLEVSTLLYSAAPEEQLATELGAAAGITQAYRIEEEQNTQLFAQPQHRSDDASGADPRPSAQAAGEDDRTLMLGKTTRQALEDQQTGLRGKTTRGTELTRVGAIMGTPVYMSPEQCAGNVLDARSDIYSLGVIAYQMLAGEPPFAGVTGNVMQEHIKVEPPPLRARNKKVPERCAKVVMTALAKKPEDRPQTAAAFASSLRGQAEGIGALYRRAFSLYSEYFPKFLRMSLIAHIPVIITTALLIAGQLGEKYVPQGMAIKALFICSMVLIVLLHFVAYFVASATISGMTTVIVTQLAVAPMRPVELRSAFAVLKKRWKPFLKTALSVTLRIIFGFILFVIPGIIMLMRYALYAPVVLMEGLEKKAARKRARELASRSWRTIIIVSVLQFLIPIVVSLLIGRIKFVTGGHQARSQSNEISQQVLSLVNIFVVPLMSIVPALLYLKMRQLGGEPLVDPLAEIEAVDAERSAWQQRMRQRLSLHPSRGSSKPRSQTG